LNFDHAKLIAKSPATLVSFAVACAWHLPASNLLPVYLMLKVPLFTVAAIAVAWLLYRFLKRPTKVTFAQLLLMSLVLIWMRENVQMLRPVVDKQFHHTVSLLQRCCGQDGGCEKALSRWTHDPLSNRRRFAFKRYGAEAYISVEGFNNGSIFVEYGGPLISGQTKQFMCPIETLYTLGLVARSD